MPRHKTELISIHTLKTSHFRPPRKNQVNSDPYTEIKSISTTHTTTKSISSLHWNQVKFIPHNEIKSISTIHIKTKSISMLIIKPSDLRPAHKNHVNVDHPHKSQVNFDPNTDVKSISMPPDTKTKLISIQTQSQAIFDPHTKPSQYLSLHWNQGNSDPLHWNQVYFDHPHNSQVNFDVNTKTMSFSARVILRVIHAGTCSCGTAAIRIIQIRVSTRVISWRVHTTTVGKPRKYCVSIYIPYFIVYCIMSIYIQDYVWYWWRTSFRSIPPVRSISWFHIQVVP